MVENKEVMIDAETLTKKYRLKFNGDFDSERVEDFYALKDVSFKVYKGDVVGIIGSNGSGKSTLLKILSQITKPTSGEARFYGETSSILDIGTNFHPDLTGRDNVNMHLHLAGKPSKDFGKFQAKIKEFSEIGEFFDQPVKIYSSGMFLRLAFSVAFHLSADILLLDEVLSVGDEGFRLKCYEMLGELTKRGNTILFVSHNRNEIVELSSKCIWLDRGEVKRFDLPAKVLGEYFSEQRDNYDRTKSIIDTDANPHAHQVEKNGGVYIRWDEKEAPGNEILTIHELSVSSANSSPELYNTEEIQLNFIINKRKKGFFIGSFFYIQDIFYQPVLVGHLLNNTVNEDFSKRFKDEVGLFSIKCVIPPNFLVPGKYYLYPRFGIEEREWSTGSEEAFRFSEKLSFTVTAKPGFVDYVGDVSKGATRPPLNWQMKML